VNAHRRAHVLLRPGVALSFGLVALIWGSTWFVIKDQLDAAPPSWSITWRFVIAAAAMAALAWRAEGSLQMNRQGHLIALGIGFSQFVCNFNFFYRAEIHLTSGIVAVLFAMLMLPNALLGRIVLGAEVTGRFLLGTAIALGGIALLLAHESMAMPAGASIGLGLAFVVGGIMSASVANVMQAAPAAQQTPMLVMLAWAMGWGMLGDAAFAWAVSGPPVLPQDLRYWAGIAYLAIIGSVVTFPLYFKLIRDLGPGRAAYNGVLVPVVAMAISTMFEGFRWSGLAVAGAVLAMVGLVVALRGRVEG
jgi:drug/metabolite transporter (DMT)-like permease